MNPLFLNQLAAVIKPKVFLFNDAIIEITVSRYLFKKVVFSNLRSLGTEFGSHY